MLPKFPSPIFIASRPRYRSFALPRIQPLAAMSTASTEPVFSSSATEDTKSTATSLLQNSRWQLSAPRTGVQRDFQFKTFKAAMQFINTIADECKVRRHHPEWANVYNKVTIRWTTHNPRGLSDKDLDMAKFCDEKAKELGEVVSEESAKQDTEDTKTKQEGSGVLDSLLSADVKCEPCETAKGK
ncbi:hypothetical protein RUND412_002355 [Rhizina undulata]